jgi:hypothetical protein
MDCFDILALDSWFFHAVQLGEAAVTVTAGYIGTFKATVPWKGLTTQPIEIDIDELELTVAPQGVESLPEDEGYEEPSSRAAEDLLEEGDADAVDPSRLQSYAGVDDGVRVIARLVENILLGLRVKVSNLLVRVEQKSPVTEAVPPVGERECALVIRVPFVEYKDETPVASAGAERGWDFLGGGFGWGSGSAPQEPVLMKTVSFKGVEVELEHPGRRSRRDSAPLGEYSHHSKPGVLLSGANGGADGSVRVSMHWKSGLSDLPKMDIELLARPVELQIDFSDIGRLSALVASFQKTKPPSHRSSAPGFVQKERALHELAGSGVAPPAGFSERFRAQKEDLLQSQYFSQKQVEELRQSVGGSDEWVSEFAPVWLIGEEGGAQQEADLAAR